MNNKQTLCPNCHSLYRVTVPQLTVAQGMVCCPKCKEHFNALLHLHQSNISLPTDQIPRHHEQRAFFNRSKPAQNDSIAGLDILARTVDHSNLDLHHYLNNLNYYHRNNVYYFPAPSLSQSREMAFQRKKRPQFAYYLMWGVINLSLLLLFFFQILWFNPQLLEQSKVFNAFLLSKIRELSSLNIQVNYGLFRISFLNISRLDLKVRIFFSSSFSSISK